jgi:uncharacterized integral membrane protein
MFVFILLTLLLLAVAVFALQNPEVVTLHFLTWQVQTSVAILALAATTAGAVIAALFGLATRLRRWQRGRAAAVPPSLANRPALTPEPGPPHPGAPPRNLSE